MFRNNISISNAVCYVRVVIMSEPKDVCIICKGWTEGYQRQGESMIIIPGYCDVCADKEFKWTAEIIDAETKEVIDEMDITATPEAAFNICNGQSDYWTMKREE